MKPIPLLEDPAASGVERALLDVGRMHTPLEYDVGAGVDRFRVNLAALAVASVATTAAARGTEAGGAIARLFAKLGVKLTTAIVVPVATVGVAAGVTLAAHYTANTTSLATATLASARTQAPARTDPSSPMQSPERVPSLEEREGGEQAPVAIPDAPSTMRSSVPATAVASPHRVASATRREDSPMNAVVPSMKVHLEETREVEESPSNVPARPSTPRFAPAESEAARDEPEPTTPAASEAVAEMRGIAAARDRLDKAPNGALAALAQVKREHPRGYFVEERLALSVLALARMGSTGLAREKAAAFIRTYPNGPYTDKVRASTGL